MSFDDLRERVRALDNKELGTGATQQKIDDAERTLRITIPRSYRQFLGEFGWARFAHQELYGLGCDVPPYLELVRNTHVERNTMSPRLPPELIPLMNDGGGNHYCLDTSRMENAECPVVFWDHEAGEDQQTETVASRFDVWIIEMLDRLQ